MKHRLLYLIILILSCNVVADKKQDNVEIKKDNILIKHSNTDITKGYELFQNSCATCHHSYRDEEFATAPALYPRFQLRTTEWIHQFLTNRKLVQTDTSFIRLNKQYEYNCLEFQNLTKQDVKTIKNYLHNSLVN